MYIITESLSCPPETIKILYKIYFIKKLMVIILKRFSSPISESGADVSTGFPGYLYAH